MLLFVQQVMVKTGQIKEHLIRQKEGFILRGFTLRKSENLEKISTLLLIRVSQVRNLYSLLRTIAYKHSS